MEKMIDLRDLLKHELMDLYSAEEQIIEAMPSMIEKANNDKLKATLKEHLKITEKQKTRLEEIQKLLGESEGEAEAQTDTDAGTENKSGFISRLFGGAQKCKGMEGLISEGEKIMGEDMTPEVLDAAIIASAQKIEHYEICGYGTARAYARELNLGAVAEKLEETLKEEYSADDLLTDLAVGKVNVEAEFAEEQEPRGRRLRTGQAVSNASSNGRGTTKSSRGSRAKTTSGGNGKPGFDRRKSTQAKSSTSSSRSASSKSSAPSKSSATRSAGRTTASSGRSKTAKTTSQANTKKGAGKSAGSRSKSSGSKGSRR